jgi:hypothetical protein
VATVRQAIGKGVLTADGIGIRSRVVFDPPKMWRLQRGCNRRWKQWALLAIAAGCVAVSADIQGPTGSDKGGKRDKNRETPSEAIRRATEIPTPRDATVRVLRGRPTEIVLEATAALRQPVEFRLGDLPRAGSLSPLRPAADSSERAVVIYTASPESATRTDSFTFRVKHRSTPTSGSATVRIEISDPRADLAVPAQIDFGEVLVGETAVRPLSIVNRGNGPYAGRLDLAPPWRLIQPTPDIELAPGERTEVRLSFSPLRPGSESFVLNYFGQPSLKTTLVGLAGSPVTVEPALVQMAWRAADHTRRGEVTLFNRTNGPALCELATSPRVQLSHPSASLAAGASQQVELILPPNDSSELQAPLSVTAATTRLEVPVTAPPAPAWLRVREAQKLEKSGSVYLVSPKAEGATLVVENAGGMAAPLRVRAPPGFALPGFEDGRELGPGDIRRLLIEPMRPNQPITEGMLLCQLEESRLSIPLRTVSSSPAAPAAVSTTDSKPPARDPLLESQSRPSTAAGHEERPLTPDQQELSDMIDILGIFPAGLEFDRSLPELESMSSKSMTPTGMVLSVKSPGPEYDCIVFRQEYRPRPSTGRPTRYWIPWEGLAFRKNPGEILITFKNLTPGARYSIRLAVKAPDGRIGPISPGVHVTMPRKPSRAWVWWLVGGLGGLGAFLWWRRRAAE